MSGPELHRGKLARHPRILSVRSLGRDDLACLTERRVGPPRVKVLRRNHHRVAKMLALGYKDSTIAQQTGMSATRIGQLKTDPAVQELIAQYVKREDDDFNEKIDNINGEMIEIKMRGLELISQRLDRAFDDEDPDPIALKDLISLTGDMADRTGHGKHSSKTVENLNFAEAMKELARRSGKSTVIDAKAVTRLSPAVPATASGEGEPNLLLPNPSEGSDAPSDPVVVGFQRRA